MQRARFAPVALCLLALLTLLLFPTSSTQQQGPVLYVNNADPTCGGRSPCFTSIQAAVDAAVSRDTIQIQAGTYVEQVRITGKNNFTGAMESDRISLEADPLAPPGSVILDGSVEQCTSGFAIRLSSQSSSRSGASRSPVPEARPCQ